MFEEMNERLADTGKCLERIGLENIEIKYDTETLDTLIKGFSTHVPYENLQVSVENRPASLSSRDLYDKIVVRKRGGYCFEMNGFFWLLLRDLGFRAYSVSAFIILENGEMTDLGHRAVVIDIDGKKCVCDVGSGGHVTADFAVPMDGEVKNGFFTEYDAGRREYTLCRNDAGAVRRLILFRDFPAYPQEFNLPNIAVFYIDNPQVHTPLCNIRNEKGEVFTIKDWEFRMRSEGENICRKIGSTSELLELAEKYFGISGVVVS